MDKRNYLIQEEGSLKKYRTEIPNTVIKGECSKNLSVYDKFLYVYLKSVAGENGMSWQSTGTLSKNTGISTGKISECKKTLVNHGLINIKKGDNSKSQSDTITIIDIWVENMCEFRQVSPPSSNEAPCSQNECPPSSHEPSPSLNEVPPSPSESNNNPVEEEPNKEKPLKNTTTKEDSISSDMLKVIEAWDKTFNEVVDRSNKKLLSHVKNAISKFGVEDVLKAIYNRSMASYYNISRPDLKDSAFCFFPYQETIKKDMGRKPYKLVTYDQKCDVEQQGKNKRFEMDPDQKDSKGRAMWRMYDE